jgi:phospholipid transport system substrate-binding protein
MPGIVSQSALRCGGTLDAPCHPAPPMPFIPAQAARGRIPLGLCLALIPIVTAAALLLICSRAEAGPPTDTLQAIYTEANRIITRPQTQTGDLPLARLGAIRALFSRAFDFRGAADRALGQEWQARTAVEKNDFTSLFAGFVQRGFVFWLASVAAVDGNGGGVTIRYLGESADRDRAAVKTAIGGRGGREVLLDHDMVYRDRRWVVRDVTIDGISLVANYRAQFDRVIRGSSYRELVERIEERVSGELPRPAAKPAQLDANVPSHGSIEAH